MNASLGQAVARTGKFTLHPLAVVRLGGLPASATIFSHGTSSEMLREIGRLEAECESCRQTVCDKIGEVIPSAFERSNEDGRALLKLKRDLFNSRAPAEGALGTLRTLAADEFYQLVIQFAGSLARLNELRRSFEDAHATEVEHGQGKALAIASDHSFRRAIDLTNRSLSSKLSAFESSGSFRSGKDRAQVAGAVARYILRAGQKISPLSSLGLVAVGRIGEPVSSDFRSIDVPLRRDIQARAGALEYLAGQLLRDLRDIAPSSLVRLNSSLRERDSELHWGATILDDPPSSRVRRTGLSWKRSSSAFFRLLFRIFVSRAEKAIPLHELRAALTEILPGEVRGRVDALLSEAWAAGFLQPELSWSDWPIDQMKAAIGYLDESRGLRANTAFDDLLSSIGEGEALRLPTAQVEEAFEELIAALGIQLTVSEIRPLLFEDCYLRLDEAPIPPDEKLVSDLQYLLQLVPMLSVKSPMGRMRRFLTKRFVEDYGVNGSCGDAFEFVSNAAKIIDDLFSGSPEEQVAKLEKIKMIDADQEKLEKLRDKFLTDLASAAQTAQSINLSTEDIASFAEISQQRSVGGSLTQMFFVQPFRKGGEDRYVLNHIYPGASSTFSRFVPDEPEYTNAVSSYLSAISEPGGWLELQGHFGFNACLHPKFASHAVSIPPGLALGDTVISLEELGIRHRAETNDLVFVDRRARDISIFYPAILSPFAMARMEQIVRVLGSSVEMIDDLWRDLAPRLARRPDGAIAVPRVDFGVLTLVRRTLICPARLLPTVKIDAASFFAEFNRWADAESLPRYLFVRRALLQDETWDDLAWESRLKVPGGKIGKPMPLDRDCPLSVQLLQKELANSTLAVAFTEALPSPDQYLYSRGTETVVAELGIELSYTANASSIEENTVELAVRA